MFCIRIDEDLALCLLEERHAEEYFSLTDENREHLRHWLPYVDYYKSVDDVRRMLKGNLLGYANNTRINPGIWFRERLIGAAGFDRIDWVDRTADLSYWLAASCQGNGIVTKSCRALIVYAFTDLKLNRIEIRCASDNRKSRAIPERLGFKEEGTIREAQWIRDRFVDHVVYGMLASEWAMLRPN